MSHIQPEGWTMAFDCWTDPVTLGMAAHGILGGAAYPDYERQPPNARKRWLLGRIAAKDAVRHRLWQHGHTNIYPIELTITNDPNGRPRVHPRPGRGFPDCDISIAHTADIGVAIARPRPPDTPPDTPGLGIDVVEITQHPADIVVSTLSEPERRLLDAVAGDGDRGVWLARWWAAKQATAKAEGAGPAGDPRRFTVIAATPEQLTVDAGGRTYRIAHREVSNPEDLPARRYVVGWTWGPQATPRVDPR